MMSPHKSTFAFVVISALLSAYSLGQSVGSNPNQSSTTSLTLGQFGGEVFSLTSSHAGAGRDRTYMVRLVPNLLTRTPSMNLLSTTTTINSKLSDRGFVPAVVTAMMYSTTQNFVAKFTDNLGTLGNSDIFDNNGRVGIGTTNPQRTLDVNGDIASNASVVIAANNSQGGTLYVNGPIIATYQHSFLYGTTVCCGAGPTGSSLGSSAGWSSSYNGAYFNSNGTADGDGLTGAQINTSLPSWRMALGSGSNEWPGGDNFAIARVAAGGNYATPSILLMLSSDGHLKITGGLDASGGGIKHARVGGCTVAGGSSSCSVTVSWAGTAFPDTNYTAVCTPDNGVGGTVSVTNKTTSSVTVTMSIIIVFVPTPSGGSFGSSTSASMTGVECMAMHD